jgi:hypothetical protein
MQVPGPGQTATSTATGQTDYEKMFQNYLDQKKANPEPSTGDIYAQESAAAGIAQKQQDVANFSAQLNTITAQAQADQLALTGQGRGIPEAIIGGQQAQIAKEAAIRALPIAAQLAAAQGNLQLAQSHLDQVYKIRVDDAMAQYKYKNSVIDAVYEFATAAEKKKLEEQDKKEQQQFTMMKDWMDYGQQLSLKAMESGQSNLAAKIASLDPWSDTFRQDMATLQSQIVPKSTTESSSGSYKFSSTQLNTGSSNAGLGMEEFRALPGDVQNTFVNNKDAAQLLVDDVASAKDGSMSYEDAKADIMAQDVPQTVKDYFVNLLGTEPAGDTGGGFWDWAGGFFK